VANGTAGNLVNPSTAQLALADSVAQKYFGAASYASLSPAQKAQVAAAKAIRASQIGALITGVRSDYKDQIHTVVLSPKYKFNDNVTAYASWQYGEKSGSALNVNGVATTVKPERTNAYELGVKTFLLDKTLTLNADVYLMDIKDYQQNVVAVDQFATQDNINNNVTNPLAYTSVQGNVPKVQVSGVEVDAAYNGLRYTSLRAAASYNDARYKDFPNAGKPSELAYLSSPFIDRSGQRLGEAPYWTVNVSGEYRRPVFGDKVFHTSFTTAYIGSTTTDELMSDYSWVPDRATTDLAIGLGHHKGNYDVTLIAKNAFNNNAHEKGWTATRPTPTRAGPASFSAASSKAKHPAPQGVGRTAPQPTACTRNCCPRSNRPPCGSPSRSSVGNDSMPNANRPLQKGPCFYTTNPRKYRFQNFI